MKQQVIFGMICMILLASSNVMAQNEPDQAIVYVSRTYIQLRFLWSKTNFNIEHEYVGFARDKAVEFQVSIDTHPFQKCFGLPIGGLDNNVNYALTNLPLGYTDVWNIYFPTNPSEIIQALSDNCPELSPYTVERLASGGPLIDYLTNLEAEETRPCGTP